MSPGYQARKLKELLLSELPSYARCHLEPALQGDEEAAGQLTVAPPNDLRGLCAVLLYLAAPKASLRAMLTSVWDHDHRHLIAAAGNLQRLKAMFRRAEYPFPQWMPNTVRVWRGTSYLTPTQARKGHAWTLDRDVACWFAVRFANLNRNPLVLVADVPRASIAHYTNDRSECEAVIFGGVASAKIDGAPDDWQEGYTRNEARNQAVRLDSSLWDDDDSEVPPKAYRALAVAAE